MKDQKINLNEKEFLANIEEFFSSRSVKNHLRFIDHWMELMLGGKKSKRWAKPSDLYYFYEKIEELFQCCNQLLLLPELLSDIEQHTIARPQTLTNEKHTLAYFPYLLTKKELVNPVSVIKRVFKCENLMYYQQALKEWVAGGLSDSYAAENGDYVIPIYSRMKKLIVASWLIHERLITKNSFKSPNYSNPQLSYALTEPFLFFKEEVDDPFLLVEDFFELTNLSGYRQELQDWYFMAITEELSAKNPADVYFMHNQYSSLIQAGFHITDKNLNYTPKICKNDESTMGQWLLGVRDLQVRKGALALSDEAPHVLSMAERANPLAYCKETLTLSKVTKLRFGLSEWLVSGLSKSSSIHGLDPEYVFEQYLTLQKLTEAFYLVITENASTKNLSITDTNDEEKPNSAI